MGCGLKDPNILPGGGGGGGAFARLSTPGAFGEAGSSTDLLGADTPFVPLACFAGACSFFFSFLYCSNKKALCS